MNCSVCGGPLLFDRVVFRCSCGTYIHAYCADKHILQAHRPAFEEGRVDLNGDFHLKNEPLEAPLPRLTRPASVDVEAEEPALPAPIPAGELDDEGEAAEQAPQEEEEDLEPDQEDLEGDDDSTEGQGDGQ